MADSLCRLDARRLDALRDDRVGGANGDGTVFSIATSGGSPTVLCSFSGSNRSLPYAGLTLIGSTLYGTTPDGGANDDGTVFSIATSGGSPTTLCSFNGSNGKEPYAGLTLIGSTLYGTTWGGGAYGDGTVFSIATSGGSPTTLCSFSGSNGKNSYAGLTLVGNTLYGTTRGAGRATAARSSPSRFPLRRSHGHIPQAGAGRPPAIGTEIKCPAAAPRTRSPSAT